ncbi:MAG: lipid-A-disaccharide synthase [endosymbiont of Galathealinum brachiosum]|uniref:Lipid-A-disaccharide synthase n=1 Tax=endosymbiont of Galathealinum brachiosum TaxID=2200906 RepID=A0A370DL25_9GAMM|nr:MAG: lipid-A-disaccharide synthase [endosymbiont of Galathealinum brachiosum]
MKRVMISAGEASGDMHAANIVKAIKSNHNNIEFYGMGSTQLHDAGAELLIDCADIAVVGLVEVLVHYRKIKRALNTLRESLRDNPPDLLVLVDYQEFNFKLAETAKSLGIKVLFYISPQVWAWREHRVHKIGKIIDMMAVILPFEEKFYKDANVPVRFVGNPLVDKTHPDKDKQTCFEEYGLSNAKKVVGLFPGSRHGEIKRVLPIQLAAAEILLKDKPDLQFILPVASTLNKELFDSYLEQYSHLNIKLVKDLPYNVMQCCDTIMTASGTATLEIALMGIPNCMVYKIATISYLILLQLVKIKHIGLVNIVAEKYIVKEFLQFDAKPQLVADEINLILDDATYRKNMVNELNAVRDKLGKTGGIDNMADLILEMLD